MPARKNLARRATSGRISRAILVAIDAHSPAEVKRLRDAALRGMQAPEYGSEIGRLFLADKIAAEQFEAGKRWYRLRREFWFVLGVPPISSSLPLLRVVATSSPGPDRVAYEQGIRRTMTEAYKALHGAGEPAELMVLGTCERDRAVTTLADLRNLRIGLSALATHWGLTQ